MLRQAEEGRKVVRVVADQIGRPTATTDLAEALLALADAGAAGIVHYANRGEVSWNAFAREIYRLAGHEDVSVEPITSADLKRPAVRPAYSVLSTERYETLTGKTPRDFREPLAEYLDKRASR
jgi:dTDP-4-dehydrorhamnose reductase